MGTLFASIMGKIFHPMENNQSGQLEIKIIDNGPAIIKGRFTLTGPDSKAIILTDAQQITGVALCRCGRSANQPFCDGSHAKP